MVKRSRTSEGKFSIQDIANQKFGRLLAIKATKKNGTRQYWLCKCECGNTKEVDIANLRQGHTKSCGCLRTEYLKTGMLGNKGPRWKGGRVTSHHSGYIYLHAPTHPNTNKSGYVLEHRIVMEQTIDRYLFANETVHHKNGIKEDNRPENLELRVGKHGKGQTIEDLVSWAKELLARYEPAVLTTQPQRADGGY